MIERVATSCAACGLDMIVTPFALSGLKVDPQKVLQAIRDGVATFTCPPCARLRRRLVVNLAATVGLAWREEHREKRVTLRTEAFEAVTIAAMERAYAAGRESCRDPMIGW